MTDCNQNLRADDCETDLDANCNGTLDLCEIASGVLHDTNANGVADELEVGGVLAGVHTWSVTNGGCTRLLTQDLTISGTLTIEAGVNVRILDGVKIRVLNAGKLFINGSAGEPVVFASTNVAPEAGDWGGILYSTGSMGAVTHAHISHVLNHGVRIESAAVSVTDSLITDVAGLDRPMGVSGSPAQVGGPAYGIYVSGNVSPTFARNVIERVRGGAGGRGGFATGGNDGASGAHASAWGGDGGNGGNATTNGSTGVPGAAGGDAFGIFCGTSTNATLTIDPPADRPMNQYSFTPHIDPACDSNGNMKDFNTGCRSDANGDCIVNGQDLSVFLSQFGQSVEACSGADSNCDGAVNGTDLSPLLSQFGRECGYTSMHYDYRNRLVQWKVMQEGNNENVLADHKYIYDCFGRRIVRHTDVGNETKQRIVRMSYGGSAASLYWQLLQTEVEMPSSSVLDSVSLTFVYCPGLGYVDDVVALRLQTGSGSSVPLAAGSGDDYWYHQDDLYSVIALSDSLGEVVERYDYGDYGQVILLESDGTVMSSSDPDTGRLISKIFNPISFTGREYDDETGLLNLRTRYLDPMLGRFISRDTIGIWGDPASLGNGVAYAASAPTSRSDPLGLQSSINPATAIDAFIALATTTGGMTWQQAIAAAARMWGPAAVAAAMGLTVEAVQLMMANHSVSIPINISGGRKWFLTPEKMAAAKKALDEAAAAAKASLCDIANSHIGKVCESTSMSCDKVPIGSPCSMYKERELHFEMCAAMQYVFSATCKKGPDEKHLGKIAQWGAAALNCRTKYEACNGSESSSQQQQPQQGNDQPACGK